MKTIKLFICFAALVALSSCSPTASDDSDHVLERKLTAYFRNAERALKKNDTRECDFWMARYLALSEAYGGSTKRNYFDLVPIFQARPDLQNPTAIINGRYEKEFVLFFFGASRLMWNVPEENIYPDRYVAVRSNTDESYVAQFVACPEMQTWTTVTEGKQKILASPMGSAVKKPYIKAGRLNKDRKIKYFEPYYLELEPYQRVQYVWNIEFHDMTYDGVPEIWVRYNTASLTGFTQRLSVFKIEEEENRIRPFRKYEGHPEGIARRLENGDIETGRGFSKTKKPHMEFESFYFETWKFEGEDYVKQAKRKETKHILMNSDWKKYYF